jgi:hypothetical protein
MLLFVACNNSTPLQPKQKLVGDCLFSAVNFYAQGGEIFKENGCNVTTNSYDGVCTARETVYKITSTTKNAEEKCAVIISYDSTKTADRRLSAVFPAKWLTTDRAKLDTLKDEFNALLSCLESPSKDEAAKNPVLKENVKAETDHCHAISLRINDVPGFTQESSKAPHLSFRAMRKEQTDAVNK